VECKLTRVNFRRVLDTRRVFWPAFWATEISGDWNKSILGVILIELGMHQSARNNFRYTWECHQANAEFTNKLWEVPEFLLVFIQITAGISWNSPDDDKWCISNKVKYDAWIIVPYHFSIILAIIFFHIELLLHYITESKKNTTNLNINACTWRVSKSGAPHKLWKVYTSTTTIERNFELRGSDNGSSEVFLWSFLRTIFVL